MNYRRGLSQAEAETATASAQPSEGGVRVPPGALAQYYGDLASGVVVPEDMRLEDLQFRVQINPVGNIIFSTDPVMLVSRYNFAFRRVVGWAQDPDIVGSAPSLVNFNIREQGRNFDLFKRPVSMGSLLSRGGSGNIHEWDGVYITVPGTELAVEWVVDTTRWVALVNASKEFGIQLLGDYVACAPR